MPATANTTPAQVKNPHKVRAGQLGAASRWGPGPRSVRLDALTPDQRRLVLALIDALHTAPEKVD